MGEKYQSIEILDPDKVFGEKYEYDCVVISTGNKYKKQIFEQLKEFYNVPNEKIVFCKETLILPKSEIHDIDNMMLINLRENVFGCEKYFNMWYELYKKSLQGMNIGTDGNLECSGEVNVLKMLKAMGKDMKVLFDVGANIGKYTKALISFFPDSQVHSFEPSKETFHTLSRNVTEKNVALNNVGISDVITQGLLYSDKDNSGLASLYDRKIDYLGIELNKAEQVELTTLDYYCEMNNIDEIDFLKMDIEGNEYKALVGASNLLRRKKSK